jgi:hypothetical protein
VIIGRMLVLEGAPGHRREHRVACRPAQAEAKLGFTSPADLLSRSSTARHGRLGAMVPV